MSGCEKGRKACMGQEAPLGVMARGQQTKSGAKSGLARLQYWKKVWKSVKGTLWKTRIFWAGSHII